MNTNAKEYLDNLALALKTARAADPSQLLSTICGIASSAHVSTTQKSFCDMPEDFRRGVAEWFAKGKLTCYRQVSTPWGERKNSKKKHTTTYFLAERDGLHSQLGHVTVLNYEPDWMERAVRSLIENALNPKGACQYDNLGIVNYILSLGYKFEDLGEKKP